jgi:hypothetical protein
MTIVIDRLEYLSERCTADSLRNDVEMVPLNASHHVRSTTGWSILEQKHNIKTGSAAIMAL